jgi:hypothetical protein
MGFWSALFGRKEEDKLHRLEKKISEAKHKIHLGGLKGQALHRHIRAAFIKLHFRGIQKRETTLEKDLDKFRSDIEKHMVISAEDDETKAVELIVKEYSLLYLTMHSLLLYEKYDIAEFGKFIEKLTKFQQKKHLDKAVVEQFASIMTDDAEAWRQDIESLRKLINSVFEQAKGKEGWALTLFNKMHQEGFFIRYQERKKLRETLKDENKVEKAVKRIERPDQIKSIDDIKKLMSEIKEEEKEMAEGFTVIYKMLLNSWDNITNVMSTLLDITKKAANVHEIPAADVDIMGKLHDLIVDNLDGEYLHALRIDDKQLEGEYSEVLDRIQAFRKAA